MPKFSMSVFLSHSPRAWLGRLLPLVLVAAVTTPALAAKTIYRCEKSGQVTLSDQPCSSGTSDVASDKNDAPPTAASSAASLSPVGNWTGQIQFQGIDNGRTVLDDHGVVLGNFEFTGDGKVSGVSSANGCKVLGAWSQGTPVSVIWLDITVDGCVDSQYNRRYRGSFLLAKPDSSAALSVQAAELPSIGQSHARNFDIKGTLRR